MTARGQNPLKAGATKVEIIICKMYDVDISESEGLKSYVVRLTLHLDILLHSLLLFGF